MSGFAIFGAIMPALALIASADDADSDEIGQ